MEPVQKTWDATGQTRKLSSLAIERSRERNPREAIETIRFRTKKGKYVVKDGQLVPTIWSKVRGIIRESIHFRRTNV